MADIISGANPGTVIRNKHREWYRELFGALRCRRSDSHRAGWPVTATMPCPYAHRGMSRRDGKPFEMRCLRCSICWRMSRNLACAPRLHWMFGFRIRTAMRMALFLMNAIRRLHSRTCPVVDGAGCRLNKRFAGPDRTGRNSEQNKLLSSPPATGACPHSGNASRPSISLGAAILIERCIWNWCPWILSESFR